jgi:hypothetical protein
LTGEEFLTLWASTELRQFIVDMAKSYTRDTGKRMHLMYMAWLAVGLHPFGKDSDYYCHVAAKRMGRQYEIYLMPLPKRWKSDDPGKRRAIKFIKKTNAKRCVTS